jgi:hypothetical protein
MKTINFKNFEMFDDISKETKTIVDVRRELADNIYRSTNGIVALDLALKIHKSNGPVELTDEEYGVLEAFAMTGTPRFIESFRANVKDK